MYNPDGEQIFEKVLRDLADDKDIFFSFRVCKLLQRELLSGYDVLTKIGFVSNRNHHTPYLTLDRR